MKRLKLCSVVVALAVFSGAMAVPAVQAEVKEELPVVIYENFDGESPMEGWTYPESVVSVVPKADDNSEKTSDPLNQCLKSVSRTANSKISKNFEPLGGLVEVSYKLRLDEAPAVQVKLPEIRGNVAGSSQILTSISLKAKSAFYAALDVPSGSERLTGAVLLGVWHDIKVLLDTDKDVFSLWVDNRKMMDEVKFYQGTDAQNVSAVTFFPAAAGAPDFAIDDYCVRGNPAQETKKSDVRTMKLDAGGSEGLSQYIKQSHPKIMLNSFDEVREKIQKSEKIASWYSMAKTKADEILEVPMVEFSDTADNNTVLNYSRDLEDKVKVLSLVYQLEREQKYIDHIYQLLENAGSYPTWLPTSFLSVAEFVMAYTIAYDWNYDDWTPQQRQRILDILVEKGLSYGVDSYQNGKPIGGTNFVAVTNNWNLVCNGALMTSALAICDVYPNLAEYILEKGAASIQKGLSVYAPMGAYPEGTMYYSYGTNFLTYIMASLKTAFREDVAIPQKLRFDQTQGLEESPLFLIHMTGTEGMFNYGDAAIAKNNSPLLMWFATQYHHPEYHWYYVNEVNKKDSQGSRGVDRFFIDSLLWYDCDMENAQAQFPLDHSYQYESGPNNVLMRSSWYDDEGIYVGLKGGLNRENHSALSVGTFVLDALGERWATMRGAGTYSWPGYQDRTGPRYQYYSTRTEGQNTLVLNPKKSFGQDHYATGLIEKVGSSDEEAFGVMDMTQAYSKDADLTTTFNTGVSSAKRGIRLFDNRSKILIQDEIEADSIPDTWWFMHTGADIRISDNGKEAMLEINGKRMYARIVQGPEDARFYLMDAKPMPQSYHPPEQSDNYGKKLAVHTQCEMKFTLAVELIPLYEGQAPPKTAPSIIPLSQWEQTTAQTQSLRTKMGGTIALEIGNPAAFSLGKKQLIDPDNQEVTPVLKNSVTMVPARFIAEQLGDRVSFDEETKEVRIQHSTDTIVMKLGEAQASVNGRPYLFQTPVQTIEGRTVLPLREFCEMLGAKVAWNENGLILISQGEFSYGEDAAFKKEIADYLDFNIMFNGRIIPQITLDTSEYSLYKEKDKENVISYAGKREDVQVAQENETVTICAGEEKYVVRLYEDTFEHAAPIDVQTVTLSFKGDEGAAQKKTWIPVEGVLADGGYENTNVPENTADNNINTRWSAQGHRWIRYDFGKPVQISSMSLAGHQGDTRKYIFDVEISDDGEHYETLKQELMTSGTTNDPDIFELGNIQARYVRLQCHGYTDARDGWNSYSEVRFYESREQEQADRSLWETYFHEKVYQTGETIQIDLKALFSDGTVRALPLKEAVIQSDHEAVASVKDGVITATGAGSATITALYQSDKSVRISSKTIQVNG